MISRSALRSVQSQHKASRTFSSTTYKICSSAHACSYACARRQSEKVATALWDQDRYKMVKSV